jgi:selenocysteine lyase/cysteine desulfurase
VDIDMRSGEMDGYDAVFLSPHKFVGGPGTPGILLMNRALYRLAGMPPSTCGGGTVAYVNGFSEEVSEATNDKLAAVLAPTLLHASLLICSCM